MNVVDRVFPKEIRNFLKVACRYQRMNLIEDIFTAYDRYCDEQNQVLNAVLTCIQPPTEEQKKEWRRSFVRNMAQRVLKSKSVRTKHCSEDLFSRLAVMSMTGV